MGASGTVRIGISGWNYAGWRGQFYPAKLAHRLELAYAANIFPTIEINGTFYSLQRPESFAKWRDATPEDFVFAVKGSRFITHMLRLTNAKVPLANFFASGVLRLGTKLGPILWQLPPKFKFDPQKLQRFFKMLPRDTGAAAALARKHDKRVSGRCWMRTDSARAIRHCLEIRNKTFLVPEFIELLRANDVGLVCSDAVEWPRLMNATSDFVYCRLHGSEGLYASGYDDTALEKWAERVTAWARGDEPEDATRVIQKAGRKRNARDVFVYFDNDAKVRAPFDAQGLMGRLRTPERPRRP
ncbi:MAG TPA: DUF72 domain-containing protein [Candidatus Acidoferrales bacterium]|nr:DUF72 domain-containing protein [Candidatus Acidoferrales bacterium]